MASFSDKFAEKFKKVWHFIVAFYLSFKIIANKTTAPHFEESANLNFCVFWRVIERIVLADTKVNANQTNKVVACDTVTHTAS